MGMRKDESRDGAAHCPPWCVQGTLKCSRALLLNWQAARNSQGVSIPSLSHTEIPIIGRLCHQSALLKFEIPRDPFVDASEAWAGLGDAVSLLATCVEVAQHSPLLCLL